MSNITSIMHIRKFYFVVLDQNFKDFQKQKFEEDNWKDQDQMSEAPSQMFGLEIFEEIESLDENPMEGSKLSNNIWNPQKDLIEQYVISISIGVGLDFKDLERMINSRETQQSEVREEISAGVD